MNLAERTVLEFFRRFDASPREMLFFNPGCCPLSAESFQAAMDSLIVRRLVVKERPRNAYSLTRAGYERSLTVTGSAADA